MIGALLARRTVPKAMEALNNRDLETFIKDWADDVVLVYPGDIEGVSGTHIGKSAVRDFYERDFHQFPVLRLTPKSIAVNNIFDMTGDNIIIVQWEAEATNRTGFQIQNSGISVMKVQRGKVKHIQQYIFDTGEKFRTAWGFGSQQA